jgi:hypothetical protein
MFEKVFATEFLKLAKLSKFDVFDKVFNFSHPQILNFSRLSSNFVKRKIQLTPIFSHHQHNERQSLQFSSLFPPFSIELFYPYRIEIERTKIKGQKNRKKKQNCLLFGVYKV